MCTLWINQVLRKIRDILHWSLFMLGEGGFIMVCILCHSSSHTVNWFVIWHGHWHMDVYSTSFQGSGSKCEHKGKNVKSLDSKIIYAPVHVQAPPTTLPGSKAPSTLPYMIKPGHRPSLSVTKSLLWPYQVSKFCARSACQWPHKWHLTREWNTNKHPSMKCEMEFNSHVEFVQLWKSHLYFHISRTLRHHVAGSFSEKWDKCCAHLIKYKWLSSHQSVEWILTQCVLF